MSRRQSRRWWRPAPSNRPPVRSRRRVRVVTEDDAAHAFELGYEIGQREERKRAERRDEMLLRLSDACEAASNGDHGPMDELMREAGFRQADDLLDVAKAAGVTPLDEDALRDAEAIGNEVEAWLRDGGE